jgi:hypothetical protein
MKYTLTEAAAFAERRGILISLEPHQLYSKSLRGLDRVHRLVESDVMGIKVDTGNAFLSWRRPHRLVKRHWRSTCLHPRERYLASAIGLRTRQSQWNAGRLCLG